MRIGVIGGGPGRRRTRRNLAREGPVDVGGSEATPWLEGFARVVIALKYGRGRGDFVYRFQPT